MRRITRAAATPACAARRALAIALVAGCARQQAAVQRPGALMTPADLQALPSQSADRRIAYGPDSSQFGDLRIPSGPGPHPVVILIHGGCFKAAYATLRDLAPMGDALKALGIASWNLEYRRLGEAGAGWPGTYQDIARGVDHLRAIASEHALDLNQVAVVGHSAGGHLALWAASRHRVPPGSALSDVSPLRVRGVLDLAGPADLAADVSRYEGLCGDRVLTAMAGGTPVDVPAHYAQASPIALLPTGIPEVLLIGEFEEHLPRPSAEAYVRSARRAGDRAALIVVPGVGHFEIASPTATSWPQVERVVRALLRGRSPE